MAHTFYLVPSGDEVGLTSVALGLVRALDKSGIRVAFYKPIGQSSNGDSGPERSTFFIRRTSSLTPAASIPLPQAERLLSSGRKDELLDRIMEGYYGSSRDADVVVVEGLVDTQETSGENLINRELVQTLGAEVILVGAQRDTPFDALEARLGLTASQYGGFGSAGRVVASIINHAQASLVTQTAAPPAGDPHKAYRSLHREPHNVIGVIPRNPDLLACRTIDVARHLKAKVLHEGEIELRRVRHITLLARTVGSVVGAMRAGNLLITPGDRVDIMLLTALAAANKIPISGLVLTGALEIPEPIIELCRPGLETGLPVLHVPENSWETSTKLAQMSREIPSDDLERAERVVEFVADHIDVNWIVAHTRVPEEVRLSPAAFTHRISALAREAKKRIVLPEGTEPRTVRAAAICAERGIAECILLGDPAEIRRIASAQEISLPENLTLLDPATVRGNYVAPLVERRKHKGMNATLAAEILEDNVWLGTMMLDLGEVDGLVSGAVHSTANTIRPALQIIKTKPDARIVSSVFFMCLPEQVVVYGDCAVVPDPDAEALCDIAIQSADSAAAFGIQPRVAMVSYSTGESGTGQDVEKVREATRLAQARRPDLLLDGPLQYDAAAIPDVAAQKAPDSPVAGRANVFVFPDLNTGNTTYKAVQRSAHVMSIGPMLQGLRRPVNDLSRGALIEDIVYTIAITAIQASSACP